MLYSEIQKNGIYLLKTEIILKDKHNENYKKSASIPIRIIGYTSNEGFEFVWFPSPDSGIEICYANQIKSFTE